MLNSGSICPLPAADLSLIPTTCHGKRQRGALNKIHQRVFCSQLCWSVLLLICTRRVSPHCCRKPGSPRQKLVSWGWMSLKCPFPSNIPLTLRRDLDVSVVLLCPAAQVGSPTSCFASCPKNSFNSRAAELTFIRHAGKVHVLKSVGLL